MGTYKIERDGFFFRVVNTVTGWKSALMTSASQAGLMIERKAGKEAHRAAAEAFLTSAR
jgi:hypothetical protein